MPDLEAVQKIAGENRLICNQVLYHLSERAIEHAVIPWCEKHGVAVVAYSPFGQGISPARTRPLVAYYRKSPPLTMPPLVKSRSDFWCGTPRSSQSPRHPTPNTPPKTRELGNSISPKPRSIESTQPSRPELVPACFPCCEPRHYAKLTSVSRDRHPTP